jgi:hypothetical protein
MDRVQLFLLENIFVKQVIIFMFLLNNKFLINFNFNLLFIKHFFEHLRNFQ